MTTTILLSDIFAQAATHAAEAIHLRGKKLDAEIENIRMCMSEARDFGIYYRDDNVETIELLLEQKKITILDAREILTKLNILVRCAEWVEHVRFQKGME